MCSHHGADHFARPRIDEDELRSQRRQETAFLRVRRKLVGSQSKAHPCSSATIRPVILLAIYRRLERKVSSGCHNVRPGTVVTAAQLYVRRFGNGVNARLMNAMRCDNEQCIYWPTDARENCRNGRHLL